MGKKEIKRQTTLQHGDRSAQPCSQPCFKTHSTLQTLGSKCIFVPGLGLSWLTAGSLSFRCQVHMFNGFNFNRILYHRFHLHHSFVSFFSKSVTFFSPSQPAAVRNRECVMRASKALESASVIRAGRVTAARLKQVSFPTE